MKGNLHPLITHKNITPSSFGLTQPCIYMSGRDMKRAKSCVKGGMYYDA